jgi:hypothetical protein
LSLAWSEVGSGLVVEDERLMAALGESFGRRIRCGRKKKLVCRRERKVHGGSRWSLGGCVGEKLVCRREKKVHGGSRWSLGGCVGFMWWSWWWLWLVVGTAEKEGEKKTAEMGQKGWFLADFGPDFLLSHAMKSTSIIGSGRG